MLRSTNVVVVNRNTDLIFKRAISVIEGDNISGGNIVDQINIGVAYGEGEYGGIAHFQNIINNL